MSAVVWSPVAERELDDLLYYIARVDRRPTTGERVYFEIKDLAEAYARVDAPRHKYSDAPDGWFYFQHKRWLIFYQLRPKGIEVMRVVDGSRDLPAVLR
jgi:plasmid stabilization system protein ParE